MRKPRREARALAENFLRFHGEGGRYTTIELASRVARLCGSSSCFQSRPEATVFLLGWYKNNLYGGWNGA